MDESALSSEEQMARILASGKYSELSANGTPLLPGEELGPIPSDSEIFGTVVMMVDVFFPLLTSLCFLPSTRQNRATAQQAQP